MRTTWRVEKVTAAEGQTLAELVKVEWYKVNPDYDRDKVYAPDDAPDEFVDCDPSDPDAEYIESVDGTSRLTLDITDGLDLQPGDNLLVTFDALERVSV